jgi:hypothetical protein
LVRSRLPELSELEALVDALRPHARARVLARVEAASASYPVWAITLGSESPSAPSLAFVGGVHGLERIGTQVVLAFLRTLSVRLAWDELLHFLLERVRLLFVPLVNPGGMALGTRANPRGVDLMRNAPPHPEARGTFLVGGQRLSPRLPWYGGSPERELELESRALVQVVEREILSSDVSIALDCHSGFGVVDRLWFPYARTRRPFPRLAEVIGLKRLLDATLPNHVYRVEPQAQTYTIVGDLWDYLYDRAAELSSDRVFVPLTLEMGSWLWVRKNPAQLASIWGTFNPTVPHRLRRTLRRHLPFFDLLLLSVASPHAWLVSSDEERAERERRAYLSWKLT